MSLNLTVWRHRTEQAQRNTKMIATGHKNEKCEHDATHIRGKRAFQWRSYKEIAIANTSFARNGAARSTSDRAAKPRSSATSHLDHGTKFGCYPAKTARIRTGGAQRDPNWWCPHAIRTNVLVKISTSPVELVTSGFKHEAVSEIRQQNEKPYWNHNAY